MREVELKCVVDDLPKRCAAVERAGATLVYTGGLQDRRYDTPDAQSRASFERVRPRTCNLPVEQVGKAA